MATRRTGGFGAPDRLHVAREYQRVSRVGRRVASAHFVALLASGGDPSRPRLGVTASRRVGGAVRRNLVKRRIREWFREERGRLAAGEDCVVIARPGAAELESGRFREELESLLEKVGR